MKSLVARERESRLKYNLCATRKGGPATERTQRWNRKVTASQGRRGGSQAKGEEKRRRYMRYQGRGLVEHGLTGNHPVSSKKVHRDEILGKRNIIVGGEGLGRGQVIDSED